MVNVKLGGVKPGRSIGLKMIVIFTLIILMAIPIMFISIVSFERSSTADDVTREVSQSYGGAQTILGPTLIIPYEQRLPGGRIRLGDYIVSADTGVATFDQINVREIARSLYQVPVYTAQGTLSAEFPDIADISSRLDDIELLTEQARIIVGLQDVTGLQSDVQLSVGDQTLVFEPYQATNLRRQNIDITIERAIDPVQGARRSNEPDIVFDRLKSAGLTLLSVPATDVINAPGKPVSVDMSISGAPSLSVLPFAKSTTVSMQSDWPHPGFEGRFPPSERQIAEDGFSATWSIPYLRRGIIASGRAAEMSALTQSGLYVQVNFVSPLNPYQTVNRALKYAILFIGLVFISYFLMETLIGTRVHPAQYLLIGLAQAVFYLLLLAFAERFGFTLAFIISALATVTLTALYAGAVFGRSVTPISVAVFGSVYGLLFVLMRIQDFALMVGALVCFTAIAATLYLTRNLDWYGTREDAPISE